jgi:hypothetical protein
MKTRQDHIRESGSRLYEKTSHRRNVWSLGRILRISKFDRLFSHKEITMKSRPTTYALILAFAIGCASAYAQMTLFLEKEWVKGSNRYCQYTGEVIITIDSYKMCPLSIKR